MNPTIGGTSWIIPRSSGSSAHVEITLLSTAVFRYCPSSFMPRCIA